MPGPDSSGIKPARPFRPVRGAAVFLLAATPLVLLSAAWVRTPARSYYAAFFTPGGAVQGVSSHGGRLMFAFSNVTFGRERGLTMLADGVVPPEFEETFSIIYEGVPDKRERWGFGYARYVPDPDEVAAALASSGGNLDVPPGPRVSHLSVVMPIWAPLAIAIVPPLRLATRGLRRWRRWRGGGCLVCGYDLRSSHARCPECGTPFTGTRGVNS